MSEQGKNPSIAPGPMAGYLYQPVRALYWLANGESGTAVGIETEDDITVLKKDSKKIREQDKLSTQENGWPYGDTSYALWNTLYIWVKAIKNKEIDIDKTNLFLVSNKSIPNVCLVKKISEAIKKEDIENCLNNLYLVGKSIDDKVKHKDKVNEVLSLDSTLLGKMIGNITFENFDSSIDEDGKQKIITSLHLTEREEHDHIIESLLGWIIKNVCTQLKNRKPGWIRRDRFDNQLEAIRNIHRKRRVRASSASKIHVSDMERKKHCAEIFVKQLEIIGADDDVANTALTDFVRFGKEKIRLASEGNITEEDWENFNNILARHWTNMRNIEKIRQHKNPEVMGQAIYHTTIAREEKYIGDLETEPYLISGSYHNFANDLSIGWHPEYKIKLKKFIKKELRDETSDRI